MFLPIADVLSPAEVVAIVESLNEQSFVSGKSTAGGHAQAVKENEQALEKAARPVLAKVEQTLLANPVFMAAARPKLFVKTMISRYRRDMEYGLHVDEPMMNGVRTDLSFTLFLSEPEDCEGGELVIEGYDGDRGFKLPSGSLILYPSSTLHRVAPVASGERLAVVGWVRSLVRNTEDRELLFDLENALAELRKQAADRAILDTLYKVRANLLRKWVED
jgi:PKHD-type hydroxylase